MSNESTELLTGVGLRDHVETCAARELPTLVATYARKLPREMGAIAAGMRLRADQPAKLARQTRVRRDGSLTSVLTDPMAQAWSLLADVWQTGGERCDERSRQVVASARADHSATIELDPLCVVPTRTMVQAGRADGSAWGDPESLALTLASDVTVTADGVSEVWAWDRREHVKGARCVRDVRVIGVRESKAASNRALRSAEHVLWSLSLASSGMGLVRSSRLWAEASADDRSAILAVAGLDAVGVSLADEWTIVRMGAHVVVPSAKRLSDARDHVLSRLTAHADKVRHVVGATLD